MVARMGSRRWPVAPLLEPLEDRRLLSATLYVTPSTSDATHFATLQAALAAAVAGDTVILQPGFATGVFGSTTLSAPVAAGATTVRTAGLLDVGDVVSIGSLSSSDPMERALVTSVAPSGSGDYLVTLATPLAYAHSGSKVDAASSSTSGPTIGLAQAITLTADAGVTLPYNLEIWTTAAGAQVSNLTLPTLFVEGAGTVVSHVAVTQQLMISSAGNTFSFLSVTDRTTVCAGSTGNTISDSTLGQLRLNSGSSGNTFQRNTLAGVLALGVGENNGHDQFLQNTFTAKVSITGNTSTPTADLFSGNTFSVSSGDALTLEGASGTVVTGNVFSDSSAYANALVVHNADNVVVSSNQITTTGTMGTGVYVYADGTGSASADITGNTIRTTSGWALYFAKYDTTAGLEARVQNNDLRGNAMGVYLWGDGASAGNIDLGGGSTRFGTSAGMNDLSSYMAADGGHFAIGLFATSASFTVPAGSNLFGVANPLTIVADATHTTAAGGSGVVAATAYVAPPPTPVFVETLTAVPGTLTGVETGTVSGIVATFTSNATHAAGDFAAMIAWGDGTSSAGTVTSDGKGGYVVSGSHAWAKAGSYTLAVSISDAAASTSVQGSATIASRLIALQGLSFSVDKKSGFTGTVATFTDTLPGTTAGSYVVSIAWSDGTTSAATLVKNADGSFSVQTARSFSSTGTYIGTVSVGTLDGAFFGTASLSATVTNTNGKLPGPKTKQAVRLLRTTTRQKMDYHASCRDFGKSHGLK